VRILHAFADHGVESEALATYGDVTRATIDPRPNAASDAVRADATDLPFAADTFDLALFHPPCTAYSDMPSADDSALDLIPEARAEAERVAEEWVIENKPAAPLRDPVVLDGKQFGLPVEYARAFETSFRVPQPPRQQTLGTETSPFFYTERTAAWWASVKGVRGDYPKEHVAKNCLPLAYVHYLARAWLAATDRAQGVADYDGYDAKMDERRARERNEQLPIPDGGRDGDGSGTEGPE
jgi:hypothetical protein